MEGHRMKAIPVSLAVLSLVFVSGCASGAGKQIAKGAIRGSTHGAVEQFGTSEIGKGAAHGALGATHQVVDQNQSRRAAEKAK